jgi:hypothetical protein
MILDTLILDSIDWQMELANFQGKMKEVVMIYYGIDLNKALE